MLWATYWDYIPIYIQLINVDKYKGAILLFADNG